MSKKTSSGQTWDERYSEEGYAFGVNPNDFLVEANSSLPSGDVLVLGDGDGRNGVFLAESGHRVVTVDLSEVGVKKAQQLAAQRGVNIDAQVADLETFAMGDEKWDAIVSIFCHVPTDLRRKVHRNIHKALKSGGVYVLEAYNKNNIGRGVGGPQTPDMTVELSELQKDFTGWSFEIARQVEREIVEGKFHNGMSATTQVVVRKP